MKLLAYYILYLSHLHLQLSQKFAKEFRPVSFKCNVNLILALLPQAAGVVSDVM